MAWKPPEFGMSYWNAWSLDSYHILCADSLAELPVKEAMKQWRNDCKKQPFIDVFISSLSKS